MNEILIKLKKVSEKIAKEKGAFVFLGLFKRKDFEDRWDIVASATWFSKKEDDLVLFLDALKVEFGDNMEFLETIQLISPEDDLIKELVKASAKEKLPAEFNKYQIQDIVLNNFYVVENELNDTKSLG